MYMDEQPGTDRGKWKIEMGSEGVEEVDKMGTLWMKTRRRDGQGLHGACAGRVVVAKPKSREKLASHDMIRDVNGRNAVRVPCPAITSPQYCRILIFASRTHPSSWVRSRDSADMGTECFQLL